MYEKMFKDACVENDFKNMNHWYERWRETTANQNDPYDWDTNFLYAATIIYAILYSYSGDSNIYNQMESFFEVATTTKNPKNLEVYDWYKSTAQKFVLNAKQRKNLINK